MTRERLIWCRQIGLFIGIFWKTLFKRIIGISEYQEIKEWTRTATKNELRNSRLLSPGSQAASLLLLLPLLPLHLLCLGWRRKRRWLFGWIFANGFRVWEQLVCGRGRLASLTWMMWVLPPRSPTFNMQSIAWEAEMMTRRKKESWELG